DVKDAIFQGIDAQRRVLGKKGELTKVTSEVLLEAATTYLDLLQARSAEAVASAIDQNYQRLLEDAQRRAQLGHPNPRDAEQALLQTEAEVARHHRGLLRARQQGDLAAIKLARLLGVDGCVELVPGDPQLLPFDLVDAALPPCELVERALRCGPG